MLKKKKLKPICKNCSLFDRNNSICRVVILSEGERINIPVDPDDKCFFNNKFTALEEKAGKIVEEQFKPEIEQVRWWVEDPETGQQTKGNGVVKMQYPKNFFSPEDKDVRKN
ncbi:MAG: hypothetical protein M0R80_02215 [Proteobacteria bacterium]|jgi:hypothetical protein|nr:hypothetical protein [Pseudomonadota bacterium]